MIVQCPECNKKYDLDETNLPKGAVKVRGPTCKHVWTIVIDTNKLGSKPKEAKETRDLFKRDKSDITVFHKLLPIEDLLTQRAMVGLLGEKPHFAWWRTSFMSEPGLRFLKRIFPRTHISAALQAVGKAACAVHDRSIGRREVYHLFRLPDSVERQMRAFVTGEDSIDFLDTLKQSMINGKAQDVLENLADTTVKTAPGPLPLGKVQNMFEDDVLRKIAGVYLKSFQKGKPSYPYFEVGK